MENHVKVETDTVENLQKRLKLQRQIMEKFHGEIIKRDKILENIVAGGDVTFTNRETNTFELYIKQVPFKVEKVTLNPINWDELMNSVENAHPNSEKIPAMERKRPLSASSEINTKSSFFPAVEKRGKMEIKKGDSVTGNGNGNGIIFLPLTELNTLQYFKKGKSFLSINGQRLSRILQGNRESLVKLILEPNTNPSTTLIIPRLPNVKLIQFNIEETDMDFPAFFPFGFHVSFTFPKLEQVVMKLETGVEVKSKCNKMSSEFLCFGEPFETVQNLSLIEIIPPAQSLRKIRSMFPRLTKFQLKNSLHEVAQFLPLVFHHFPHIHQLVLEIDTDTRRGNLDSALTGINAELCRKLEKKVPRLLDPKQKEKSGQNLSHLKDLRLLKFVLRPAGQGHFISTEIPVPIPVLTPVAFEYGLGEDQVKKLDILLEFHSFHEENKAILASLRPVFPYFTTISTN